MPAVAVWMLSLSSSPEPEHPPLPARTAAGPCSGRWVWTRPRYPEQRLRAPHTIPAPVVDHLADPTTRQKQPLQGTGAGLGLFQKPVGKASCKQVQGSWRKDLGSLNPAFPGTLQLPGIPPLAVDTLLNVMTPKRLPASPDTPPSTACWVDMP